MATPTSFYREQAPAAWLADYVLCVWTQVIGAGATPYRQRVLPDGCADLVWIGASAAVIAGPATRPVDVPLGPDTVVTGIRLRPGALPALLGPPASQLVDRATPLRDLWRTDLAIASGSLDAAQALLGAHVADAAPPDPSIIAATRWLARHPAGRIDELARSIGWSGRRLHRRFTAAVGYGPKTFQRVVRLQRVLTLAGNQPMALLALDAGYADQAHMSREVRALAGRSPRELLRDPHSTLPSDLFKTDPAPAP
jgi:AraC-like DNA-binding protein